MLTRRIRTIADRRRGRIITGVPWQKPFRGTLLNTSHPLTRGLVGCWVFNEFSGLPFDLVKKKFATTTYAGFAWGDGGIEADGDDSYWWLSTTMSEAMSPPFTVVTYGNWTEMPDASWVIMCSDGTTRGWSLRMEGYQDNGYVQFTKHNVIDMDFSSLTSVWDQDVGLSAIVHANNSVTCVLGQKSQFVNNTSGINANVSNRFSVGDDIWDTFSAVGTWKLVLLFSRELTISEITLLHREPYCMFQQERRVSILTPLYDFWPDDVQSLWYSKGNYGTLPTDDTDLEDDFQGKDYENVEFDDNMYVSQTANGENAIFQFKEKHTNYTDPISATWMGKSTLAPSSSTVYLQVYNRKHKRWDTLDENSTANADTEFTLEGSLT